MMNKRYRRFFLMLFVFLMGILLTACSGASNATAEDPNAIYTQAAATVQSQLTEAAAKQPTATETLEPTETAEPTATAEPTEIPPTPIGGFG